MENKDFQEFISKLNTLRLPSEYGAAVRKDPSRKSKTLRFMIKFYDAKAWLSAVDGKMRPFEGDSSGLEAADANIFRIIRQNETGKFCDSWGESDISREGISLEEHSYLSGWMHGSRRLVDENGDEVLYSDDPAKLVLSLSDMEGAQVSQKLVMRSGEEEYENPKFVTEGCVLAGNKLYDVAPVGANYDKMSIFLENIPRELLPTSLSVFLSYFSNIGVEYEGERAKVLKGEEQMQPALILEKVGVDKALYMSVSQMPPGLEGGDSLRLRVNKSVSVSDDGKITVRPIDDIDLEEAEKKLAKMLADSAPNRAAKKDIFIDGGLFIVPEETASPFLYNCLPEVLREFRVLGAEKLREYKVSPASPKLNIRLGSGIDFLEGDADVEIGNEKFTLADIIAQFSKKKYIQLNDGTRAIIEEGYMRRLERIFRRKGKDGKVKISFFDLPEVEELLQNQLQGEAVNRSRAVYEGFNHLKDEKLALPDVKASLRGYQERGVKWIKYLYDNRLGGCLADDMGLGKTVQTITMLAYLYPGEEKPSLIVMPRSLLFNWSNELAKFAPQISVATYYGQNRDLDECLKANVILTTYAVARNDIERLKDIEFQYVVLDESQNIKNLASQTAQAVTLLNSGHRLALSGTPIENNLTELYSLFRFLNPAMFGTADEFNRSYTVPIQKLGDQQTMESLRRKIYPFMLRRVKKEVLTELPDRIEQTLYVEMDSEQQSLYERKRLSYLQNIRETIGREGIQKSQFVMFQALSELRRIASVPESLTDGRVKSPKLEQLVESVEAAVGNGHKVVVFFNFIAGLELAGERLGALGIDCESMTGSTSTAARRKIVERFQNDPSCQVLLMTLKVGGVGLNLTAADIVYIFEPWWNKAAEEQAVNRLHRIGQKATVYSYSMITMGTIEEKILQLQQQKKDLFDGLIGTDTASEKQLSEEDIEFILGK